MRQIVLHLLAFAWVFVLFAICAPLAVLWPTLAWRNRLSLWAGLQWSRFCMWICGIDVVIEGRENLRRPAILTFNHTNYLDFFINAFYAGDRCLVFGKHSLARIPFVGWGWFLGGHPLVDRTRPDQWHLELARVEELARDHGYSVCIAPEGKRSRDGILLPFRKGAFHLALATGNPIVPIVIRGAAPLLTRGMPLSGTVKVQILPAIATEEWTLETIDEHIAEVRGVYLRSLGQPSPATVQQIETVERA